MPRLLRNTSWLFIFLLTVATSAQATQLTLEECLILAKEQNPLLKAVRWDQKIADDSVRQADSALFPRVDAQGGYTAQMEPQAMRVAGQTMETQQSSYAFANIALTQTIYDFGKRDAKRGQARSSSAAVESSIRSKEQDVAMQVIEAYFAVLESDKLVVTAKEELNTVEQHRKVALAMFESGVVTRNDLLQADVRLASARQKLLALQNRSKNLRLQLGFLIGRSPDSSLVLLEPATHKTDDHLAPDTEQALLKRPDLVALRRQVEAVDQEVKESRALFYPELFARGAMDYLENNKVREQAIYSGTIGLKINLFDGFASTSIREKAVSSRSRSQQTLRLAEEQARLEIASAKNDADVAKERIAVTLEAIKQGEENLRINQDRYQERVGTATEVLDAQTLLTQTKTEHYRAFYDYQIASARLRKALGQI